MERKENNSQENCVKSKYLKNVYIAIVNKIHIQSVPAVIIVGGCQFNIIVSYTG